MVSRIKPIVKKEIRQVIRDKRTLILLLAIPAFMLVLYGYALNFDVKHIPLALLDEDRSPQSRELAGNFLRNEYFDLILNPGSRGETDALLERGSVRAVLIIPRGFADDLQAGRPTAVQTLIDGADARAASTALGYINGAVQNFSTKIALASLDARGGAGSVLPLEARPRIWYNQELKSAKFLIPGLIAFILMVIVVISTALSVVREKERGTMEQILVSPIRPGELIVGKTIPYVFISLLSTAAVLGLGRILFGVAVRGSGVWLFLVVLVFLIGGLSLGLLLSTLAETQQVAFMLAVVTTLLPTFILSGFVFPIRNMPVVVQAITYLFPARYFLSALRSIMLKGSGLGAFGPELLALLIFAVVVTTAAALRFRRFKD
jgi:ABC-2 type transport system permease protein